MFSPPSFASEVPALLTGHPEIDQEHRLLLGTVAQLRQICQHFDSGEDCRHCDPTCSDGCQNFLVQLLGDLLMFLIDHFRTEETLMKARALTSIDREICERHKEDHAAISQTIQQIVASLDTAHTAVLIRKLHTLVSRWLETHIQVHDFVLVRMLTPHLSLQPAHRGSAVAASTPLPGSYQAVE